MRPSGPPTPRCPAICGVRHAGSRAQATGTVLARSGRWVPSGPSDVQSKSAGSSVAAVVVGVLVGVLVGVAVEAMFVGVLVAVSIAGAVCVDVGRLVAVA